jgi:two-component system KDP operon response regulator KdpE
MLADMDGVELCRRLRGWSPVPIIVLAADSSVDRKIVVLDSGADDYITKPFSPPDLLARVRVALRRSQALGVIAGDALYEIGDLRVDIGRHEASQRGRQLELTPKEFAFLTFLARHHGRVMTHDVILRQVWGTYAVGRCEYLRTYVNLLRKKLREDPGSPRLITEPGVGYRLAVCPREETHQKKPAEATTQGPNAVKSAPPETCSPALCGDAGDRRAVRTISTAASSPM